jgi:hypothetical protein
MRWRGDGEAPEFLLVNVKMHEKRMYSWAHMCILREGPHPIFGKRHNKEKVKPSRYTVVGSPIM